MSASRDLDKIRNRHWFTLRQGSHPAPKLQTAWQASGGTGLVFEMLETLDENVPDVTIPRLLKERRAHGSERLGANLI